MLEMIRRIFKIAGRSRQKIIVGITFNILKSFFNGFMMFGVFWILLHLENLLHAFGVVLGSAHPRVPRGTCYQTGCGKCIHGCGPRVSRSDCPSDLV